MIWIRLLLRSRSDWLPQPAASKPPERAPQSQERQQEQQQGEGWTVLSLFTLNQVRQLRNTVTGTVRLGAEVVLNPRDEISAWLAVLCPPNHRNQNGSRT